MLFGVCTLSASDELWLSLEHAMMLAASKQRVSVLKMLRGFISNSVISFGFNQKKRNQLFKGRVTLFLLLEVRGGFEPPFTVLQTVD